MKAQLIGERSAGLTAVEIYSDDGELVWSNTYFDDGASDAYYTRGLFDAWSDMRNAAEVQDYEGGNFDEAGNPQAIDIYSSTGVMLEYSTSDNNWSIGDDARTLGQSREIVDACMLAGLIPADDEHDDLDDDDRAHDIAKLIKETLATA